MTTVPPTAESGIVSSSETPLSDYPNLTNHAPATQTSPHDFTKPLTTQATCKKAKVQCLVLGAAGAGKTSILRRYFYKTFEKDTRVATLGSDFYIGRVSLPNPTNDGEPGSMTDMTVNLQMWDTPGRERFYLNKRKRRYTASLSDTFFRHADAVMLVYDMTSSTSFTQLLRWYADVLEIRKKNCFPVLIVGNKRDLFVANQQRATTLVHPRRVAQRNVMGLGRDFRGRDFRYEYRVSTPIQSSKTKHRLSKQDVLAAHGTTEHSFFLANRENWTTDNSYLDSLLNSEDASHPSVDMVLLWCMRNGLQHMEVSAATGEGVDQAIESILRLALQARAEKEPLELQGISSGRKEELDFHERYAAREEPGLCCCRPLPPWFR
ncbi:hypothetical protein ACA910_004140 [Epithemia clementina (nom. ined.)]